jgi:hypothetical protein
LKRPLTLAKHVLEDRGAQRSVLVENLVHDIPGIDLAFVAGGNGSNVILNDRRERGRVGNARHPGRELRVPDDCSNEIMSDFTRAGGTRLTSVSTNEFAVALGKVDQGVEPTKVEVAALSE